MKMNLDKIKEIYGESAIIEIKNNIDDVVQNINTCISLHFRDVYDILENNPYIFLQPSDLFEEKIKSLIQKLGVEYIEKLEEDMTLWGEME